MDPQTIIQGLVQRGIPVTAAQGIAANMMAESGLNPGVNEKNPLVAGSRGGYGLNQWTGPRRVQYEQFAASRGASPDDPNTQLDFTVWELQNTEKSAGAALMNAPDAVTAARIYSNQYLRPGIPHMDQRMAYAQQMQGIQPTNGLAQPKQTQQPQQNQLVQRPQVMAMLDPASLPRNRLRA